MTPIESTEIVFQKENRKEIPIRVVPSELVETPRPRVTPESLAKGQEEIFNSLTKGLEKLSNENLGLSNQNIELLNQNKKLLDQVEEISEELNKMKKEREDREMRRETRAKRKRLPKRDEMTSEIYKKLIQAAEGPSYINVRLRIALCLLAVTGVRINELLPLKVNQIETLIQNGWIAINRSKRGPTNHKAFLTQKGKKIVEDRKRDFEYIFLMKSPESYIFTSGSQHFEMLRRETITREVNKVMRSVADQLPDKPNLSSHSFRVGYISQLWKDSKDIEFVRQSIGHQKVDSTSSYVQNLSDEERQERINQMN